MLQRYLLEGIGNSAKSQVTAKGPQTLTAGRRKPEWDGAERDRASVPGRTARSQGVWHGKVELFQSFGGPAMDLRQRAGHGNGLRVKTMAAAGRKTQCNWAGGPLGGSKVHWKASGCVARHEFGFCPNARRLLHFPIPLTRPETPAPRPRTHAACRHAANAPRLATIPASCLRACPALPASSGRTRCSRAKQPPKRRDRGNSCPERALPLIYHAKQRGSRA